MSPSTRLGSAFSWTSDSPCLSADDLLEQPAPQLGPACPHPRAQPRSLLPESHAGATLLGLLLGQAWTFPLHLPRASDRSCFGVLASLLSAGGCGEAVLLDRQGGPWARALCGGLGPALCMGGAGEGSHPTCPDQTEENKQIWPDTTGAGVTAELCGLP